MRYIFVLLLFACPSYAQQGPVPPQAPPQVVEITLVRSDGSKEVFGIKAVTKAPKDNGSPQTVVVRRIFRRPQVINVGTPQLMNAPQRTPMQRGGAGC